MTEFISGRNRPDLIRPSAKTLGVGVFPTGPVSEVVETVRLAEDLGYETAWIGDSQTIWRESNVSMTAAALATSKIIIGSGVTNTVTRHISVTAAAFATLAELSGGRTAVGIGPGDSSVRTMGLSPSRLVDFEQDVLRLQSLLRAEQVKGLAETDGEFRLEYLKEPSGVPIFIGATGKRTVELAGRIADGIILAVGAETDLLFDRLDRYYSAVEGSGRQRDDVKLSMWIPTAITSDSDEAISLARAHVARTLKRKIDIPLNEEETAARDAIRENYDYQSHMDPTAKHAALVPASLVKRFAIAGDHGEAVKQIATLVPYVDQINIIPVSHDFDQRRETIEACKRAFDEAISTTISLVS